MRMPVGWREAAGTAAACAALLLLAGTVACSGAGEAEEAESERPIPVRVASLTRGSIRSEIRSTGRIVAGPDAEMIVTAPEPARIAEMPKALGDPVKRGDLLVRFEIPTYNEDAAASAAGLERAKARLEAAHAARVRLEGLLDRGIAARKDVEAARREETDAIADLAESKGSVGAREQLRSRAVVRALFDGVVIERNHNAGDLVEAGMGDPVLRVVDPSRLEIEAGLPAARLAEIEPGAPAEVRVNAGEGEPPAVLAAHIARVAPSVGISGPVVPVRLVFDSPPRLPAGLAVEITLLGPENAGVILAPRGAIVREGEKTYVVVMNGEGKAVRKEVELGAVAHDTVEIRSGVTGDEKIVVEGQAAIPEGAALEAAEPEPPGEAPGTKP